MSTICENPVASAVEKLDRQREEANRNYRALVARVAAGGEVEDSELSILVLVSKSPDDLRSDTEDATAALADNQRASVAGTIRRDLLPVAQQRAAEIEAELRPVIETTAAALGAIAQEASGETTRAQGQVFDLSSVAANLEIPYNGRWLKDTRQHRERLRDELAQPSAAPRDAIESRVLAMMEQQQRQTLNQLSQPYRPVLGEVPVLRSSHTLPEIIASAVARLTPEQRETLHDLAGKLFKATKSE